MVALKKIRLGDVKQGVNVTTLREIKLLRELRSPLIINLLEVFQHKKNLVLVRRVSILTRQKLPDHACKRLIAWPAGPGSPLRRPHTTAL